MKKKIQIFKKARSENYLIHFKCPYCGMKTTMTPLITEAGCRHFSDYTQLYNWDRGDDGEDHVMAIETVFLRDGAARTPAHRSGELIEAEDGFRLYVNGAYELTLSPEEFLNVVVYGNKGDEGI